ncbi:hypothetical protein KM043_012030 [Ampulex compressa]|nr:hypothetical protein KM043_012030 [Ampulex compressa]
MNIPIIQLFLHLAPLQNHCIKRGKRRRQVRHPSSLALLDIRDILDAIDWRERENGAQKAGRALGEGQWGKEGARGGKDGRNKSAAVAEGGGEGLDKARKRAAEGGREIGVGCRHRAFD